MLLAVSGLAGCGKDTVADILARRNLVKVALADPLKRIARDVYDFTDEQLWGPSYKRNEADLRYPRPHTWRREESEALSSHTESVCACCGQKTTLRMVEDDLWVENEGEDDYGIKQCYLTPRYSLQTLGTEWGRDCYPDTWVDYAIRVYNKLQAGDCYYDYQTGLRWTSSVEGVMTPKKSAIISDTRFKNELRLIQAAGGKVIRIKRPGVDVPAWQHRSETEQMEIPDDEFDYVLVNDGTLGDLGEKVQELLRCLGE